MNDTNDEAASQGAGTITMLANTSGRAPTWFVLLLFAIGLAHLAYFMGKPLSSAFTDGFPNHNAARYAIAGRNYVRHGFAQNLGAPDLTPGLSEKGERDLYLHHPPLAPLLVGLSFVEFGESERSARLPFFALGLLVPFAIFLLARRCFRSGSGGPALAALFSSLPPMATLYGGHVDPQGPIVVLAVILETWAYLRFRASRSSLDLVALSLFAIVGMLSDWSAAYPIGVIAVADRILPGGTRDRRVSMLPLVPIAFFLAFLAWVHAIGQESSAALFQGAAVRTFSGLSAASHEEVAAALETAGRNFVRMFTTALIALGAIGSILALFAPRWRTGDGEGSDPVKMAEPATSDSMRLAIVVLALTGIAHIALFPQGALVHDYWTFLLLPAFALAAANLVETVRFRAARSQGEGFAILISLVAAAAIGWPARSETVRTLAAQELSLPKATLGRAIREAIRPDQRVLTNLPCNPISSRLLGEPEYAWYSDRRMRGGVKTADGLALAEREEGRFDYFVYTPLPQGKDPVLDALESSGAKPRVVMLPGGKVYIFPLREPR